MKTRLFIVLGLCSMMLLGCIDVTKDMLCQNLMLHFGGVHSAMYVWINGQKVGYSQNSMSPAEFDVTKYLREGRNRLAVEVYRWCDGKLAMMHRELTKR